MDAHVLKNAMEGLLLGTVTSRSKHGYWSVNPLTPTSDQDRIFSLQYQYNINQITNENKEKYQYGDN